MDITKETNQSNPKETANIFSQLFFGYTIGLFKKGYKKPLDVEDIYTILKTDKSEHLGDRLQRNWLKEVEKSKSTNKKPRLLRALTFTFWPEYLPIAILLLCQELGLRLTQPVFLAAMLDYFNPSLNVTKTEAFLYAAAMLIISFAALVTLNHYVVWCMHSGLKVRAATCALIYRKALKLSKAALGGTSSGKIVNLLSNDVSRFDIVSITLHQMWVSPITALVIMYLLYRQVGYAGIVGVAVVFIVTPLQSYTGKLSGVYRKKTAVKTDERVRLMDEIILGIQVIKMYAWEKPFERVITLARKAEVKFVKRASYVKAVFTAFGLFTTKCALFCTILTMVLSGQEVTASRAFLFMAYFNTLSSGMASMFVRGMSEIAELLVAVKRIEGFLLNEEHIRSNNTTSNGKEENGITNNKYLITLKDYTVKWGRKSLDTVLNDLNISVRRGELLGVIGPVGSGKSALLQSILGEMEVVKGSAEVSGRISYASQEPWVFSATLRQNILFGAEYNKTRYKEVVKVCALEKDFLQFENGDLTIVGEKGASLSGGQKARINLARAVYRNANIYLLDDPLSAVDIHVSKHIYEQCIMGFLRKRTRILVTHQVHYLKTCDHILLLNNGVIEDEGTFNELASGSNPYASILNKEPEPVEEPIEDEIILPVKRRSLHRRISRISQRSKASTVRSIEEEYDEEDDSDEEGRVNMKLMQEDSSKGKVKGNLLFRYLIIGGNFFYVFLVIALALFSQVAASGVDYWVNYFTNIQEYKASLKGQTNYTTEGLPFAYTWSTNTLLFVYGGAIIGLFVIVMARSILFFNLAMSASSNMHKIIFNGVTSATMRFFDTNPSGRILNRFSKDMGAVDEALPRVILDSTQMTLQVIGAMLLVVIVNPYFLIILALLLVLFGYMRKIYLKTSRNLKRLEGMMRSPVFTHLNATLQGLTTIRAYNQQNILQNEFDKYQNYHSSAYFMYASTSSAFGFYLNSTCFLFTILVTFSMLALGESLGLKTGEVGLAITQSNSIANLIQWAMRTTAEVSNQLMSVERVLEYKNLPKEPAPVLPKIPADSWPSRGQIIFKNVFLRYFHEGPQVLKDLNFTVQPKEKVGIVGRTGAGKSSLISALFRLAPIEGEIIIDDIDTNDIKLETLRLRISIIPQDPVLFSGTLRYNLDPFEEYSDEILYKALDEVELKDPANIINRLENKVMDKGSNYSVGQRQLICLARAIIRNNKILLLDEATANVDPQTDALIQKTIREKFVDCTVITVAHRLNTVIDSDKILVMDSGRAVEYEHPHVLLQDNKTVFYGMVEETGPVEAAQLRKQAEEHYKKDNIQS